MAGEAPARLTSIISTAQVVELRIYFSRPGRDWTTDARAYREAHWAGTRRSLTRATEHGG